MPVEFFNRNIPDECHQQMENLSQNGAKIVCVAFPPQGGNGWSFEPVCAMGVDTKPPTTGPQVNAYALSYKFPGAASGHDWGDNTQGAGAAGWYLSIDDIAKVLNSLNKNDGRILTSAQLQDMQSTPLGWDTMTDATGYRWVEKNGGWKWNGTSISASIALFGPGVFGALFINSDQAPNNPGAATILHDAYINALKPKT